MSLSTIVPNTSEIQSRSKEICMAIEDYLNETQSICDKIYEVSNHGEYDLNNNLKLLSGTSDYHSSCTGEDFSKTNESTNEYVQVTSISTAPCSHVNASVVKPSWSQKPIVIAGGNGAGSELNQLHHPNDVALDANGTIYIADYSNKRVMRWRKDSDHMGEIVAGGDIPASSPLALSYPRRIYVSNDGSLFILDDDRVLKLTENATNYTIISDNLNVPTSLFVDNQNNVYVAERGRHRILKWTPDMPSESEGIPIAGIGKKGSAANALSWPRAVYVDNSGNLYTIDRDNARIQYWPKDALSGSTVVAHSRSRVLFGLIVDTNGNIYTADWKNNQILKYSSDGREEILISDDGTREVLNSPTGLAFDQHGNLFVNDKFNHRVVMFPLESGTFGC